MTEDLPHDEHDPSADHDGIDESTEPPSGDEADSPDADSVVFKVPPSVDALNAFANFGARHAFSVDPELLKQIRTPEIDISSFLELYKSSFQELYKNVTSKHISESWLRALGYGAPSEAYSSAVKLTHDLLRNSISVDRLYTEEQLSRSVRQEPRDSRTPEDFFGHHQVEVGSVPALLKALRLVQSKHHEHRPVWRGHQDAKYPAHSSLYRKLEETGNVVEDRLMEAEIAALSSAKSWGMRASRPMEFLAKLQHNGAPTRLLDATVDPEIATWFAVEEDPELDQLDGMVLGWGRVPRTRPMRQLPQDSFPESEDSLFWHSFANDEDRHRVDWGTGTKTWAWFPPALNRRMRAQRAGFLLEAAPILTDGVVDVFTEALSQDWRASEIARATSIVGLPSRHDVLTRPNDANLVPIFTLRILAKAKREIRDYLQSKGLSYATIYPDFGGLVQHLKGPFGPHKPVLEDA